MYLPCPLIKKRLALFSSPVSRWLNLTRTDCNTAEGKAERNQHTHRQATELGTHRESRLWIAAGEFLRRVEKKIVFELATRWVLFSIKYSLASILN